MLGCETCPITTLVVENTNLTTSVNAESQDHSIQPSSTCIPINLGPVLDNDRLTMLNLCDNKFSGDRFLILAECVQVCHAVTGKALLLELFSDFK